MKSLVPNIRYSIQSKFCGSLLQKDRFYCDVVIFRYTTKVIQEACDLKYIEGTQASFLKSSVLIIFTVFDILQRDHRDCHEWRRLGWPH